MRSRREESETGRLEDTRVEKNKKERPKMPVSQRAKQFMPFAAVTGLEKALKAKEEEMAKKTGR